MSVLPDRTFKRQLYQQFNPFPRKPIECDGPLYVDLYDGQQDPIAQIEERIDLSGLDSLQLLSGSRGTGKTTELNRLRHRLTRQGYIVLYADALEYLNPALPIEINELIVVLTAAFSEQVADRLGEDPAREGYLTRLWNYLSKTDVTLQEFGGKGGVPGFEANFKATLRTTESFRQSIARALAGRTQEIKNQADEFIRDALQWLRNAQPDAAGIVFLFDSLEQLRGSTSDESKVMDSVERLFTQHRELLCFDDVHLVYTVPPWLRYRAPGAVALEKMLPCVKLWQYEGDQHERCASPHGWSVLRELVTKRVGAERMSDVFGPPDGEGNYDRLDRLIQFCGGHFRDLLTLLREALSSTDGIEIQETQVERAIAHLRVQFPIAESDAEWLRKIHESQWHGLPDSTPETVSRFTRFLDHHLVLLFENGREWYDVHPIILEEVFTISDRLRAQAARAQSLPNTPAPAT